MADSPKDKKDQKDAPVQEKPGISGVDDSQKEISPRERNRPDPDLARMSEALWALQDVAYIRDQARRIKEKIDELRAQKELTSAQADSFLSELRHLLDKRLRKIINRAETLDRGIELLQEQMDAWAKLNYIPNVGSFDIDRAAFVADDDAQTVVPLAIPHKWGGRPRIDTVGNGIDGSKTSIQYKNYRMKIDYKREQNELSMHIFRFNEQIGYDEGRADPRDMKEMLDGFLKKVNHDIAEQEEIDRVRKAASGNPARVEDMARVEPMAPAKNQVQSVDETRTEDVAPEMWQEHDGLQYNAEKGIVKIGDGIISVSVHGLHISDVNSESNKPQALGVVVHYGDIFSMQINVDKEAKTAMVIGFDVDKEIARAAVSNVSAGALQSAVDRVRSKLVEEYGISKNIGRRVKEMLEHYGTRRSHGTFMYDDTYRISGKALQEVTGRSTGDKLSKNVEEKKGKIKVEDDKVVEPRVYRIYKDKGEQIINNEYYVGKVKHHASSLFDVRRILELRNEFWHLLSEHEKGRAPLHEVRAAAQRLNDALYEVSGDGLIGRWKSDAKRAVQDERAELNTAGKLVGELRTIEQKEHITGDEAAAAWSAEETARLLGIVDALEKENDVSKLERMMRDYALGKEYLLDRLYLLTQKGKQRLHLVFPNEKREPLEKRKSIKYIEDALDNVGWILAERERSRKEKYERKIQEQQKKAAEAAELVRWELVDDPNVLRSGALVRARGRVGTFLGHYDGMYHFREKQGGNEFKMSANQIRGAGMEYMAQPMKEAAAPQAEPKIETPAKPPAIPYKIENESMQVGDEFYSPATNGEYRVLGYNNRTGDLQLEVLDGKEAGKVKGFLRERVAVILKDAQWLTDEDEDDREEYLRELADMRVRLARARVLNTPAVSDAEDQLALAEARVRSDKFDKSGIEEKQRGKMNEGDIRYLGMPALRNQVDDLEERARVLSGSVRERARVKDTGGEEKPTLPEVSVHPLEADRIADLVDNARRAEEERRARVATIPDPKMPAPGEKEKFVAEIPERRIDRAQILAQEALHLLQDDAMFSDDVRARFSTLSIEVVPGQKEKVVKDGSILRISDTLIHGDDDIAKDLANRISAEVAMLPKLERTRDEEKLASAFAEDTEGRSRTPLPSELAPEAEPTDVAEAETHISAGSVLDGAVGTLEEAEPKREQKFKKGDTLFYKKTGNSEEYTRAYAVHSYFTEQEKDQIVAYTDAGSDEVFVRPVGMLLGALPEGAKETETAQSGRAEASQRDEFAVGDIITVRTAPNAKARAKILGIKGGRNPGMLVLPLPEQSGRDPFEISGDKLSSAHIQESALPKGENAVALGARVLSEGNFSEHICYLKVGETVYFPEPRARRAGDGRVFEARVVDIIQHPRGSVSILVTDGIDILAVPQDRILFSFDKKKSIVPVDTYFKEYPKFVIQDVPLSVGQEFEDANGTSYRVLTVSMRQGGALLEKITDEGEGERKWMRGVHLSELLSGARLLEVRVQADAGADTVAENLPAAEEQAAPAGRGEVEGDVRGDEEHQELAAAFMQDSEGRLQTPLPSEEYASVDPAPEASAKKAADIPKRAAGILPKAVMEVLKARLQPVIVAADEKMLGAEMARSLQTAEPPAAPAEESPFSDLAGIEPAREVVVLPKTDTERVDVAPATDLALEPVDITEVTKREMTQEEIDLLEAMKKESPIFARFVRLRFVDEAPGGKPMAADPDDLETLLVRKLVRK